MIVSPEVIVEAAGPLGDAPSRPIKAFYNLCGYDPSEESPILLSWIGDFFLSGGLPKMATCSESKQFTVCTGNSIPLICDSEKNTICSRTLTCRRWYCLHLHYISYSAKVIRPAVDFCYLRDAPKARISSSFSSDTPGS